MYDPQKVIDAALNEQGYKEKNSPAMLDDPKANAGNKNYTKFAAALDAIKGFFNGRKQGVAWCAVFVCWCFVKAFGVDVARKLLNLPTNSSAAGVRWLRIYMMRKGWISTTPQIGDIVFFRKVGSSDPYEMQHTGLVYGVNLTTVYTIEGNAGNAVSRRSYPRNSIKIADYGRPQWGMDFGPAVPPVGTIVPAIPIVTLPTLKRGADGETVRTLQTALNKAGFSLKVDGEFGPKTQAAVKAFQKARQAKADGIVGPVTWALLKAVG